MRQSLSNRHAHVNWGSPEVVNPSTAVPAIVGKNAPVRAQMEEGGTHKIFHDEGVEVAHAASGKVLVSPSARKTSACRGDHVGVLTR